MGDEKKTITLYSYSKVWKVEKKLYSIYNVKLPVPIDLEQGGYLLGVFAVMWLQPFQFLPSIIRFLVVPFFVARFLQKKKLDGKNPVRYFFSYIIYLFDKQNCMERLQTKRYREEKFKLCWVCSQGYYDGGIPARMDIEDSDNPMKPKNKSRKMHPKENHPARKDALIPKRPKTKKKKKADPAGKHHEVILQADPPVKKDKSKKKRNLCKAANVDSANTNSRRAVQQNQVSKKMKQGRIFWFDRLDDSLKNWVTAILRDKKVNLMVDKISNIKEEDSNWIICTMDALYLKELAAFIRENKFSRNCMFVFLNVSEKGHERLENLMEGYRFYAIGSLEEETLVQVLNKDGNHE